MRTERRGDMPLINFIDLIKTCEPIIYLFGVFGFYGCSLCVQRLIFGKETD